MTGYETIRPVRCRAGMSLLEVIVAIAILVVGILGIIRVFMPGLESISQAQDRELANKISQEAFTEVKEHAANRPFAIAHAVPVDAANLSLGYRIIHDDGLTTPESYSPSEDQYIFPTYVIGETFRAPATGVYVVRLGPVVPGSVFVYVPGATRSFTAVADLATYTGDVPQEWRYQIDDNNIYLQHDFGRDFRVSYSYFDSSGNIVDIVGEFHTPQAATLNGMPVYQITLNHTNVVPHSETLYLIPNGVAIDDEGTPIGKIVIDPTGSLDPYTRAGRMLAVTYQMAGRTQPSDELSAVLPGATVPDVMRWESIIPTVGDPIVRLPYDDAILNENLTDDIAEPVVAVNLGATLLSQALLPVDMTGPAQNPGEPFGEGYVKFNSQDAGKPVRIYFRLDRGWQVEYHLAAAEYAEVYLDSGGNVVFSRRKSSGPKQFWFAREESGGQTILRFYGANASGLTGAGLPDEDAHRVAVTYYYDHDGDPATPPAKVVDETHVVDPEMHGFALAHNNVTNIVKVRGLSVRARTLWYTGYDVHYVDTDGLVVRPVS